MGWNNLRPGLSFLVLSAAAALGVLYIIIIPPWQSPDEPTHFEFARVLAAGGPVWPPRPRPEIQEEIIVSMDRHRYWFYVGAERPHPLPVVFREAPFLSIAPGQIGKNPPLYYLLAAGVLRISPASSIEAQVYRLRGLSLIFTLLSAAVVWGCGVEVFGRESLLAPAAAAGAVFLPQFLVIGTSISPDPLINLCGAVAIYLVLRFERIGWSFPRLFLLLLWQVVGLLVNYKALILWAALPGTLLIHCFFRRGGAFSLRRIIFWLFLAALIWVFAYSGLVWYFPRIAGVFIIRLSILTSTVRNFLSGRTIFPPGYWPWFHNELFKSFWLKYGWLQFMLPAIYYLVLKLVCWGSLAGLGFFLIRWLGGNPGISRSGREAIVTLVWYGLAALGAYYLFWGLKGEHTTTQGRHLFLVMPAWSILFIFGWRRLIPVRRERDLALVFTAGFFILNLVSLFGYILPTFGGSGQ